MKRIEEFLTEDLFVELERRCRSFVAAYETYEDFERGKVFKTRKNKGYYCDCVMMSTILQNQVMNNWDGQLNTLDEINSEESD